LRQVGKIKSESEKCSEKFNLCKSEILIMMRAKKTSYRQIEMHTQIDTHTHTQRESRLKTEKATEFCL